MAQGHCPFLVLKNVFTEKCLGAAAGGFHLRQPRSSGLTVVVMGKWAGIQESDQRGPVSFLLQLLTSCVTLGEALPQSGPCFGYYTLDLPSYNTYLDCSDLHSICLRSQAANSLNTHWSVSFSTMSLPFAPGLALGSAQEK